MTVVPDYELFAIRYATRDARRSDHFIGGDPHDGPMPMDYFVWVAKSENRTFIIDTGFNAQVCEKRKRTFLRCPAESLTHLGIDADTVADVVLTHLHYDHAGNFDRFPKARFHLQERELAYATGRYMHYPRLSHSFEVEDAGHLSGVRSLPGFLPCRAGRPLRAGEHPEVRLPSEAEREGGR